MQKKLYALVFLALIFGVPLAQAALELARGESVHALEVGRAFREERLPAFEDDLRQRSFVRAWLVPRYQQALAQIFGRGNEKAIEGRAGTFFYADDLDLVAGKGFLGPAGAGLAALEAIERFRDALRERSIELVVVPVPVKGSVDSEFLRWPPPPQRPSRVAQVPQNPDSERFFAELERRGIRCVRLLEAFLAEGSADGGPLYLPRDTHWRPAPMQLAARLTAAELRAALGEARGEPPADWVRRADRFAGEGDLVRMLRLPAGAEVWPRMPVEVESVTRADGAPVAADPGADVLVLGDSFTRIFSDAELGFGAHAGFAEQLALELGRPIDVIAQLGGSALAVRETLARRPGGLDGKRAVVWQFGMRALGEGADAWRDVPLPGPASAADGGAGQAGELALRAELVAASRIPPEFDYAFCLVIHELAVRSVERGALEAETVWVAFPGMLDYELQPAEGLALGSLLELTLEDLALHHDLESTSYSDDTGAPADQPIWWAAEWRVLEE